MLEEDARVLEIRGDSAVVETSRQAVCDGCSAQSGCGTGLLSRLFKAKRARFVVKSALDLEVGHEVVIAISETGMLRAAFLVYVLPLLAMFAGAIVADFVLAPASEGARIAAGAAGLVVTLGWIRLRNARTGRTACFQPVIVRRKSPVRTLDPRSLPNPSR